MGLAGCFQPGPYPISDKLTFFTICQGVDVAAASDTKREPKVSWFVFVGETLPALETIPEVYARRYSLEHGFRVDKPDLLWEQAHLCTPEAFQNWTD